MPRTIRYCRPKASPEETLIGYLANKFTYLNRDGWKEHIKAGHVSVNDHVELDEAFILRQQDQLCFSPPRALEPAVDELNVHILHEDDALVVVAKNGDLPFAEGGRFCENTLVSLLQRRGTAWYRKRQPPVKAPLPISEGPSTAVAESSTCEAEDVPLTLFPVHRLDKETSGVAVVAKSETAAAELSKQFVGHAIRFESEVDDGVDADGGNKCKLPQNEAIFEGLLAPQYGPRKSYVAILAGCAPSGQAYVVNTRIGTVADDPELSLLPEHAQLKKMKMVCYPIPKDDGSAGKVDERTPLGKLASTRIVIIHTDPMLNLSVARVDLLTGRTHQIRLHCAHVGYPILGDKLYTTSQPGKEGHSLVVPDEVYLKRVRHEVPDVAYHRDTISTDWLCRRHMLHAVKLSFIHPATKELVSFESHATDWFLRDLRLGLKDSVIRLQRLRSFVNDVSEVTDEMMRMFCTATRKC